MSKSRTTWGPVFFLALIVAGLLAGFHLSAARGKYGKIKVQGALHSELNLVLSATNELHSACISRNEKEINEQIRLLIKSLNRADRKSMLAKGQRPHLVRMLDKAKVHLELTLNLSGEARKKNLKEAFINLVEIAKVYKLDKYRIFFCPSDEVLWLQKSWKPRNPVHPKNYGSCGKLVR